ncbi:hypothetical protein HPP92_006945 [Vanilla planifolia]|uniref:Inosine/uridine-preferring nucleoside hydrolase domain-containing protein n=1 Tax=Vanilla planifolia TaxID=51239 RepID=A0A835RBR5_VANPL|nr:hypothetical protein HPP92_006945 [Vanilla planifolia]
MGRDDIPVGLGNLTPFGAQSLGCNYAQAIPYGNGGFIDSDTLFGLARTLPRSPRRFTAENSIKHGAPRNTAHPELRQPLALEVWQSISTEVDPSQKITVLTNGPLTNIADIILSDKNACSLIQELIVVGGHFAGEQMEEGNLFTVPSNKHAEFNMYLDPLAAKTDIFLGEILGAVFLANPAHLDPVMQVKPVCAMVGNKSIDGQLYIDETNRKINLPNNSLFSEIKHHRARRKSPKAMANGQESPLITNYDNMLC